jgi:hypothetical protein
MIRIHRPPRKSSTKEPQADSLADNGQSREQKKMGKRGRLSPLRILWCQKSSIYRRVTGMLSIPIYQSFLIRNDQKDGWVAYSLGFFSLEYVTVYHFEGALSNIPKSVMAPKISPTLAYNGL